MVRTHRTSFESREAVEGKRTVEAAILMGIQLAKAYPATPHGNIVDAVTFALEELGYEDHDALGILATQRLNGRI